MAIRDFLDSIESVEWEECSGGLSAENWEDFKDRSALEIFQLVREGVAERVQVSSFFPREALPVLMASNEDGSVELYQGSERALSRMKWLELEVDFYAWEEVAYTSLSWFKAAKREGRSDLRVFARHRAHARTALSSVARLFQMRFKHHPTVEYMLGVADCPWGEPLHYDMDGCPACFI